MFSQNVIIAAASAASTAVGAAAGFYYAKKRLRTHYEDIAEHEIEQARLWYDQRDRKGDLATPAQAVEKLVGKPFEGETVVKLGDPVTPTKELVDAADTAMAMYQGKEVHVVTSTHGISAPPEVKEAEVIAEVKTSVFVDGKPIDRDEFDIEEERNNRVNGVPHVISLAEHDENEFNHDQVTLTYFVHDRTLVDENEREIDDLEDRVGMANLLRFGQGSGDPKIVYVRNERVGVDYEILKSEKNYVESVLGLTDDDEALEHSSMYRTPRRRRLGD